MIQLIRNPKLLATAATLAAIAFWNAMLKLSASGSPPWVTLALFGRRSF